MIALTFDKAARGTIREATHVKMRNRIDYWLKLATDEERHAGRHWYYDAQTFCGHIATELGFTVDRVAQAVAILSPQIDWDKNKQNAVLLATTLDPSIKIFATASQKEKGIAALFNEYRIPETSRKTFSFADNIANPDSTRVTVDRHATKVALGDTTANEVRITNLQYRKIESAYQAVAQKHGLMPYQVQAVCWVTYKRVVGR